MLVTLAFAKFVGLAGIGLAYSGQTTLGGCLLGLDAALLATVITASLREMRRMNVQDDADTAALKRMLAEGTLASRARELGYNSKVFEA